MNRQWGEKCGASHGFRRWHCCFGVRTWSASASIESVCVCDLCFFVDYKHSMPSERRCYKEMVRMFGKIFDYANWHLYVSRTPQRQDSLMNYKLWRLRGVIGSLKCTSLVEISFLIYGGDETITMPWNLSAEIVSIPNAVWRQKSDSAWQKWIHRKWRGDIRRNFRIENLKFNCGPHIDDGHRDTVSIKCTVN